MADYTVLFVDDEEDFLDTLIKRVRKRKIDALGAGSGEEALTRMAAHRVDVVVLDVRMRGMDGLETLKAIKKQDPLVEVIMLTGHACLEVAREGMELGAFDYLMKPVDIDELLYKVEDAYKKRRIQIEKIKYLEQAIEACGNPGR